MTTAVGPGAAAVVIAVFMGTRPEAIKMAPVVAALRASEGLTPLVVNSGQHREMTCWIIFHAVNGTVVSPCSMRAE